MTASDKRRRQRSEYPFFLSYRTRWSDNDQYAHLNNTAYYHLFDAIINTYLMQHCGLDPKGPSLSLSATAGQPSIGLVVSSFCEYFSSLSFPDVLDLGLRVTHLGKSSVTYEVGVFKTRSEHVNGSGACPTTCSEARQASLTSPLQGQPEKSTNSDAPAAVGGYTHVFVDSISRTSVPMSDEMRNGLLRLMRQTSVLEVSKL